MKKGNINFLKTTNAHLQCRWWSLLGQCSTNWGNQSVVHFFFMCIAILYMQGTCTCRKLMIMAIRFYGNWLLSFFKFYIACTELVPWYSPCQRYIDLLSHIQELQIHLCQSLLPANKTENNKIKYSRTLRLYFMSFPLTKPPPSDNIILHSVSGLSCCTDQENYSLCSKFYRGFPCASHKLKLKGAMSRWFLHFLRSN